MSSLIEGKFIQCRFRQVRYRTGVHCALLSLAQQGSFARRSSKSKQSHLLKRREPLCPSVLWMPIKSINIERTSVKKKSLRPHRGATIVERPRHDYDPQSKTSYAIFLRWSAPVERHYWPVRWLSRPIHASMMPGNSAKACQQKSAYLLSVKAEPADVRP